MRAVIAVLALSLVALSGVAAHGADWCSGAYTEAEGSNFAQCVEGVSAMVSAEPHASQPVEQLPEFHIQVGGED